MDILNTGGTQAAQGLQLTDSTEQEPVEGGFSGLFSSLRVASREEANLTDKMVIDPETGKSLPDNGELLPDFIQVNVPEEVENNAITNELSLPVGEVPATVNGHKPEIVAPISVITTAEKQIAATVKGNTIPVFGNTIPQVKPIDEPAVVATAKSATLAENRLPDAIAAYAKEEQVLAAKNELPNAKQPAQLATSNIASQIIGGAPDPRLLEAPAHQPIKLAIATSFVEELVTKALPDAKQPTQLTASNISSQTTGDDPDPRLLEATTHQPIKSEIDTSLAKEPVITEKKMEAFQALRMVNTKLANESVGGNESLAANTVSVETRTASGTGSLLRSEPAAFSSEPQAPLTLSLRQANWGKSLSSNVLWMVKEDIQTATIRVRPAELGPLNIQVSVQQEQLNVSISASQAMTREALEAALPKLREQFTAQGFSQVNVDISDQGKPQSGQQGLAENNSSEAPVFSSDAETHDQEENISLLQQSIHNSLLDTFA